MMISAGWYNLFRFDTSFARGRDTHDPNGSGSPKDRKRVSNCTRGGRATIPRDHDSRQFCGCIVGVWDNQNWPAGPKQCGRQQAALKIPPLVLPHDREIMAAGEVSRLAGNTLG